MPSSSLATYLAKNYLTASKSSSRPGEPPKKKRKKSKHQSESTGLVIADDDDDLNLSASRNGADEGEDVDIPTMYESKVRSAEFRKAKRSAWQSLTGSEDAVSQTTSSGKIDQNDDDADTLLRAAQSDEARRLAEQEVENAPAVVEMDTDDAPRMQGGMRAGLQTAADTARLVAEQEAREEAEQKALRKAKKKKRADGDDGSVLPPEEETIYRDATGRRIDVSLRRAEARKEAAEKARAKQQEKLDAMGDVQRRQREEHKKELDEAKFLTLGRSVEDEEYNDRLRDQVRWDDPMAAYMAEKRAEEDSARGGGGRGKKGQTDDGKWKPRRREYQGPAPPNRYGIKPGWRWDGVDRGNGFEKEWFQARSKKSRNEALSYEWQMDE